MVTKKQIKLVRDLHQKKYRNEYGLFAVEGIKIVKELIDGGFDTFKIFSTNFEIDKELNAPVEQVTETELKKMSSLTNNNGVIGIFYSRKGKANTTADWVLALDSIRDPGNLGTIIRLCDWYGIKHLVCSNDTVDCYNAKVLQATMGSIARVDVSYTDLPEFLKASELPIFGGFIGGQNVYNLEFPQKGILVMGNEANGISTEVANAINEKITIPQFGDLSTESLNVGTATAILLSEVRRTSLIQK